MLCIALGADPFFNNTVDEFYTSDYLPKPLSLRPFQQTADSELNSKLRLLI